MNFNSGSIISIRHYSGLSPFKSVVTALNDDVLTVKLTKEFALLNFLEGDPVVFGYEADGQVFVFGSVICGINVKEGILKLKVDKVDSEADRRQTERFPVSLYSDIREKDSKKKHLATIKDISSQGMLIYSKADIPNKQHLEIDIYMDKSMVFLKAAIVRKVERVNYYEYGLVIIYDDANTLNLMTEYLKRLKQEQEEAIRRLRNR